MNLQDLITQIDTLTNDIRAGDYLKAWEDFIPFQQTALDILKQFTANKVMSCPPAELNALKFAGSNLSSACVEAKTLPPKIASDPVGKLFPGDGSFIKALADLAMKILPILLPLFAGTPPTP